MSFTQLRFSEQGFGVWARVSSHVNPESCSILIKEEKDPENTAPLQIHHLKGDESIFLSTMLSLFQALRYSFPRITQQSHFRMSGLWGPEDTGVELGICSWAEPESMLQGTSEIAQFRATIFYSKNQARSQLRGLQDCRQSTRLLSKYLAQVDNWKIPNECAQQPKCFWGEPARLIHFASLVYYAHRITARSA